MGWYHSPDFNWDDMGGEAPACSLSNRPPEAGGDAPTCSLSNRPPAAGSCSASGASKPAGSTTEPPTPAEKKVSGDTACPLPVDSAPPPPPPDVDYIYHLCQRSKWLEAKARKQPYFPPTFVADGKFTRASVYKNDLVATANEYYRDTPGEWIVLEIHCKTLYALGIPILSQDAPESTKTKVVKCLQVFGGISTSLPGLIHEVLKMKRTSSGRFVSIVEPTEKKSNRGPEKAPAEEKKEEESPKKANAKSKTATRRFWPKLKK